MKKFIFILLILSLIISASACGSDSEEGASSDAVSSGTSSQAEADECAEALSLIAEAKYEDAYKLLLSMKNSARAAELLERFSIKPSNIKITNADGTSESLEFIYNSFGEHMKETKNGTVVLNNTYDTSGNILSSSQVIAGETIASEYTYEGGKLTKVTEKKGEADYCTITYTYSGENVSSEIYTYANGDVFKVEYTYDSNGREISEKTTLPNGKTEEIKYEYNSNGLLVKETFISDDSTEETVEYVYNDNGKAERVFSIKNGVTETKINTYSGDNLVKAVCTIQTSEKTSLAYTTEYTYDGNGKLTKEVCTESDSVLTIDYTYDSDGNLVKCTRTKSLADGTTETNIYEYSNFGYYYSA